MGCLHIVTQELHQHRIYSQNNDSVPCPVPSHVTATVWTWTVTWFILCELTETSDENFATIKVY